MRNKLIILFAFLLISFLSLGQDKNMEHCKERQVKEREFISKNGISKVEANMYFKDSFGSKGKSWRLAGKNVYEYDKDGIMILKKIISITHKGEERLIWQSKLVYNSSGVCDSVAYDKWESGGMRKVTTCDEMYPICYSGKKKLKEGLVIKAKQKNGAGSPRVVYTFK